MNTRRGLLNSQSNRSFSAAEGHLLPRYRTSPPILGTTVLPRLPLQAVLSGTVGQPHTEVGRVCSVCAPAGAGKTVLLSDWVRRQRRRNIAATSFVWLSLDERDNDLRTLWASICGAIAEPATGLDALTLATDPARLTAFAAPEFVWALTCALGHSGHRVCLVLDDAHVLHDCVALDSVNSFIRWAPANVTVIVSARHEIPLTWPQFELEGRLTRLRTGDLALNASEAAAILADHSVELSPDLLSMVMTLTRGWAAMVRLAAFYLLSRGDAETAVNEFARSPRAVSDYLVGELLSSLPEVLTRFLILTSPTETFTADLAEELSGQGAAELIDTLERLNFPITYAQQGDGPTWFSYHPLLREHLRAELHRSFPEQEADLHARAAQWFLAHNRHIDALEHVAKTHDAGQLTTFVEQFGLAVIMDGQGSEMFRILDTTDTGDTDRSFMLMLRAAASLDAGDPISASTYLDAARAIGLPHVLPLRQRWGALDSGVALGTAVSTAEPSWTSLLQQLRTRDSTGDLDIDCCTHMQLSEAYMFNGDLDATEEQLRKAIVLAELSGRYRFALRCLARLAMTAELAGDVTAAASRTREALEYAGHYKLATEVEVSQCVLMAAFADYLRGIPCDARARSDSVSGTGRRVSVLDGLVSFDRADDAHAAARTLRRDMVRLLTEATYPVARTGLLPHVQRICLRVGGTEWADQLIRIAEAELGQTIETLLCRAEVLAVQGRIMDARNVLSDVLASDLAGAPVTAISAWLLYAVLDSRADCDTGANAALEQALSLAEPMSILRPFIDGGPPVRELLAHQHGRFGDLNEFAETARQTIDPDRTVTVAMLTKSEMNILRQLASGETSEQIARELYVSVNTVKTHLRGVYRKLEVTSRREALVTARTIGLL